MVMDFRRFMDTLAGGGTVPNLPPSSQPVSPALPPVQGPMPRQEYPSLQHAPTLPAVRSAPVQGPVMTPDQFAQMSAQPVGPVQMQPSQRTQREAPDADLGGTWVTVQYQYNGVQYNMLMPEANATNLPPGATLYPGGTITDDPDSVQHAIDAGENGVRGNTFVGTLAQAPEDIQRVFMPEYDQAAVNLQNPDSQFPPSDTETPPINYQYQNPQGPTAPVMTDNGLSFPDAITPQAIENAGPVLTTEKLRETDAPKAALLEANGIFEIPAGSMVVQNQAGDLSIVPTSEDAPSGMTIVTYGGDTPNPSAGSGWLSDKAVGDPGDWILSAIDAATPLLEGPQRALQSVVTDVTQSAPVEWWRETIFDPTREIFNKTPLGALMGAVTNDMSLGEMVQSGGYGFPAYSAWLSANEDVARQIHKDGYTAPNGETFEGNRAVWEYWQSQRSVAQRTIDSLSTDPLNVLPTMGAPARGAARGVQRSAGLLDEVAPVADDVARTGPRVVEEVVDVVPGAVDNVTDIAQNVFRNAPDDFARAGTTAVDQAVTNTQALTNTQKAAGFTADVLNVVADVLDIPENALGTLVDRGVITIQSIADAVGHIPMPDGRTLGDVMRVADRSTVRNEADVLDTTTQSILGRQATEPVMRPSLDDIPPAVVDEVVPTPSVPTPTQVAPTELPTAAPKRPASEIAAERDLAVDRTVDDLGQPLDQTVAPSEQLLSVDRDVADLTPETIASERLARFMDTTEGKRTLATTNKWPEQFGYMKPQTAAERFSGSGRGDEAFELRPADVAFENAPENPQAWAGFMADYNRSLNRRGTGYFAQEGLRKDTTQVPHFKSSRFADQSEQGTAMRSAWEIVNEADHLVNSEIPLFNKHFGSLAEVPEYQWKRWGRAGESHTAMDTMEATGGQYQPGMNLGEAVEVAIFHPDDAVAKAALDDVTNRLAFRDDMGVTAPNRIHPSVKRGTQNGLADLLSNSANPRTSRRSIRGLRANYLDSLETGLRSAPQTPRGVTPEATRIADAIDETPDPFIDNLRVGERFEDIAAGRGTDVPPQALPERSYFSRQNDPAIPMGPVVGDVQGPVTPPGTESFVGPIPERDGIARAEIPRLREQMRTDRDLVSGTESIATPEQAAARDITQRGDIEVFDRELQGDVPVQALRDLQAQRSTVGRTIPDEGLNADGTRLTRGERREATRLEYLADRSDVRARNMRAGVSRPSDTDLQSMYIRGRSISADEAQALGQKFSTGESLAERWDRYTLEEVERGGRSVEDAESIAASRVINDYAREIMPDDMRKVYDTEYRKALKQKVEDADGVSQNRTDLEAQNIALHRAQYGAGRKGDWVRRYDAVLSGIRKAFLYNWLTGPRYVVTQMAGNGTTLGLTKHGDVLGEVMSPGAIDKAWRAAHNDGILPTSVMDEVASGYGTSARRELTRGSSSVRDQTLEDAASQSAKKGNSLLGRYTAPFADKRVRDMAAAFDQMPREGLWANIMDTNLLVARQTLRERMLATIPAGMDQRQAMEIFDALPQRFGSDDLRNVFMDTDPRWADRHARDWQEAINKTDRAAQQEVKRVFFDGTERNADLALKRIFMFHYWMSRAVPLYTEAIARNPVVLYNYGKLLEAMQDDSDLSGTNFVKFMSTPMGYNILIRPDAMLATLGVFMEDSGFEPDGESFLGKMIRKSPIMVNPLIQSVMNVGGFMGDTFGPDPIGANKWIQFTQAAIDNANAQFGWGLPPVGNAQETAMRWARDHVSGVVDQVTPDWLMEKVPYSDPMAYKENEVREIIATIALERGLPVDDPIVTEAFTNPESELYQEAMKRYAKQDAFDIAARILPVSAILYPKSQLASPKQRSIDLDQERKNAENLGVNVTPQGEALYTERDTIAASDDYSRSMQQSEDEYKSLGSPEDRAAYEVYNSLRFGYIDSPIIISGQRYTPDQIQAMSTDEQSALADQWATGSGNTDRVERQSADRKAFRDEHPDYQEYVSWSGQLRDYDGGVQGWWQDVIQGNPNAANWYNNLSPEDQQNDRVLTQLDAYFAYKGDQLSYWDDRPIETRTDTVLDPYNPIGSTGDSGSGSSTPTQSGPSKQSISEQAMQYQADMDAYNQAASRMLGQQVIVDQINPMARNAVIYNLESIGVEKPRMGGYLYDYMQWAEMVERGGGGDTSVDAYLNYYNQQNPPETTPETQATNP